MSKLFEKMMEQRYLLLILIAVGYIGYGVLGLTGIETGEIVRCVCDCVHPALVIAVDAHEIKETEIIINNRPGYLTVMVDIFKRPLVVIKMDRELFSIHYALFP